VAQEVLAILEGHASGPQAPAERVPQVRVHAHVLEGRRSLLAELCGVPSCRPSSGLDPPRIVEVPDPIAIPLAVLLGKDIHGMLPTHLFEHRLGHVVQDDGARLPFFTLVEGSTNTLRLISS
jgi:hypothetical protein